MKIVVLNYSGNVGKTTVCVHLLAPRMRGAEVFSVESINQDAASVGLASEKIRGRQFGQLSERIMLAASAVVDVGSSNVEEFLQRMAQYEGSHEDIDLFVVPVVPERKQQADTINTLRALAKIGVPAEKVRVIFNKADPAESVDETWAPIIGLHKSEGGFELRPGAVLYANEVYERAGRVGQSISALAEDKTDHRAALAKAKSDDEKSRLATLIAVGRLAKTAVKNLDAVYDAVVTP